MGIKLIKKPGLYKLKAIRQTSVDIIFERIKTIRLCAEKFTSGIVLH